MSSRIRLIQFEFDISRARELVGLGHSYTLMTKGAIDASDIYRASLVQTIAALDHYVHGVILDLAVDVLLGRREPSGKGTRIGIPFDAVQQIVSAKDVAAKEQLARTHVAQRLSIETFQKSSSISTGLGLVGVNRLWSTAFPPGSSSLVKHLDLIVERRNKIVHQGDSDPLRFGEPTPIELSDALDAVTVVEKIVRRIDPICN
ncbi:HEPN domain-containing protein [Mycetocola saprophilus]|uniref:HEPN domain-containing protein n=1 Tax=Mycetocola saprophilus TaxID=76636 RepID=UPI003BF44A2B